MKYLRWIVAVGLLTGCSLFQKKEVAHLWFHEQVNPSVPPSHRRQVTVPVSNLTLLIDPRPALTEQHVLAAEVLETAGGAAVMVKFNIHGAMILDELTTRGRGQYLVVLLDGRPIAAWLIERRLNLGHYLLEADLTDEEAHHLADVLNEQAKKYQSRW